MQRLENLQRATVLGGLGIAPIVVSQRGLDPFHLPTATVILLGTVVLIAAALLELGVGRRFPVPTGSLGFAIGAFFVAATVACLSADVRSIALTGVHGRYTGLAMYVCYGLWSLWIWRLFNGDRLTRLMAALMVGGGAVSLYALVQALGADPLPWVRRYGDAVFSTFGNPNFLAGYAAILLPVAVWGLFFRGWSTAARAAAGLLAATLIVTIVLARSIQGPMAGGLGLAVLAFVALRARQGAGWGKAQVGVVAGTAITALIGGLGLMGLGPMQRLATLATVDARLGYWRAALAMLRDNVLLGVGMDRYEGYYRAHRTTEEVLSTGLFDVPDAPHNVVLGMFATGGLLLGLTYCALVAATGWLLLQGLRQLHGNRLFMLGGLGGAWVAYQAQSLVSIDVPGLALLHFVLAGAIAALVIPDQTVMQLRGASATWVRRLAPGFAGLLLIVGIWAATFPLRADRWAGRGVELAQTGQPMEGIETLSTAADSGLWVATYRGLQADTLGQVQLTEAALTAFEDAIRWDPRYFPAVYVRAQGAAATGDLDDASRWYARLLELEPANPRLRVEAARVALEQGDEEAARSLIESAVALDPQDPGAQELLEEVGG